MRFTLIDRITEIHEGESIAAVKGLSLAEEYLQDHFPRFPVMPGVLMLESMYQAAAWLVRKSEDFAHSVVLLRQAKNIKFQDFVGPGQLLTVRATIKKQDASTTTLKCEGHIDEKSAVTGRLVLERFNLVDRFPDRGATDEFARRQQRQTFQCLFQANP